MFAMKISAGWGCESCVAYGYFCWSWKGETTCLFMKVSVDWNIS